MIARILAVFHARNLEFVRDRGTLSWNIMFPVIILFGLNFVFSEGEQNQFKIGVLTDYKIIDEIDHPFMGIRYINKILIVDQDAGLESVRRHQLDMLVALDEPVVRYWINEESPTGYIVEKILLQSSTNEFIKGVVQGKNIRYVEWLLPGVLGMNLMFGCLFGVGYVIVRYRKNGFLKRLKATPLRAIEFIIAQVLSRLILAISMAIFIYVGASFILETRMEGSYFVLLLVGILGAISLISMGLLIASRVSSEELAGGLLNLMTWPMMVLSGVFFSLEGSPPWVQTFANIFPLTHTLTAARAVMIDGATVLDISYELSVLVATSIIFMIAGALLFKWQSD